MSTHVLHSPSGFMTPFMPIPQIGMPSGSIYLSPTLPMAPQRKTVELCKTLSLPDHMDSRNLSWDLRIAPSSTTITNQGRPGVNMTSYATTPAVNNITISCRADLVKRMWPDIPVTQSLVTVGGVLKAIYDHFQQEITEDEYKKIQAMDPQTYPHLLNNTRNDRSALLMRNKESILKVQLRRVDCLGEKHNFGGLRIEYLADGSYSIVLHLTSKKSDRY